MTKVDIAQICLDGHIINPCVNTFPKYNKKFCDKCGKEVIDECTHCEVKIQGNPFIRNRNNIAPAFCHKCGEPYPWTETKNKVTEELIQELEEISEDDKMILTKNINDIIIETPETNLAVIKIKKIFKKYGEPVRKILYKAFIDIASETTKKLIKGE